MAGIGTGWANMIVFFRSAEPGYDGHARISHAPKLHVARMKHSVSKMRHPKAEPAFSSQHVH